MLYDYKMIDSDRNMNDSESKDEITSITANNMTWRPPSVIDDDVGSINIDSHLDLVPVREKQGSRIFKSTIITEPIEIVDVYTQSRLDKDDCHRESSKDKMPWREELDRYDLEHNHRSNSEEDQFSDDNLQTIIPRPRPLVTLTKHEPSHLETRPRELSPSREHVCNHSRQLCRSPIRERENLCRHSISTDSTDIGRQITQLAQRIESLGNISRVYQNDSNYDVSHGCACVHTHHSECPIICQEQAGPDPLSMKTARKLDKVERLQKRQEAMQSRLTDLAKKLNDSTRDLSKAGIYNENMSNDEDIHTILPKTARKSTKKASHKGRKNAKKTSTSFLKNILNDGGDNRGGEVPLISSSYCLPHALSTGSPESVMTDATSKYLNDELNNIRHEFRTQVEEIRRLLSERYQQAGDSAPQDKVLHRDTKESLTEQIEKSMAKIKRDTSPSLRNITNVSRYEDQSCPLDKYLAKRTLDLYELPSLESNITPSLRPGILPSVAKAIKSKQRMFSDPIEAERFLVELRNRRANLENNISTLERAKEGQFLFSILEKLQGNETSFEVARIQAMVDDAIVSMNPEIQWEVKQEFQAWVDKRRQRQQQQEIDDEAQHSGKLKHPRSTKIVQHVNYHQIPSSSAVAQKPWLCKKYWAVRSKVDTGLRKHERPVARVPRMQSPTKVLSAPCHETRSTWANRRRYRTPYLHFVNDIKLAKKSIGPLGDEGRRIPIISGGSSHKQVRTEHTDHYHRSVSNDDLVLLGVRQYSLNYREIEEDKVEKPISMARATSPRSESRAPIHKRPVTPPSPSMSEIGTGFNVHSRRSSRPREDRVGPFIAIDPLEEPKIEYRPVNVRYKQPEIQRNEPDINSLRLLIERAIYDQIEIPSPTSSTDLTLSVPKASLIATPLPSERTQYSEDFGPESPRERTEHSMTMIDGVRTPDMSRMSTDRDYRLHTPISSPTRSLRTHSVKNIVVPDKISEAVQTISDKANQTIEDKEMQTSTPIRTQTEKEEKHTESVESFSTTSGLEGSLTDTMPDPWSDGMWLLDRSEGEMADHYLQPVTRWNLGSCPDNPQWPHGTEDLVRLERQSTQSFGEFVRPTLPGLVPTIDGVLQLKTLPLKKKYNSINMDFDHLDESGDRRSSAPNFKLIRMSRDSRSKLPTPRSVQRRSPGGQSPHNSDGEVDLGYNYDDEDEDDQGVATNYHTTPVQTTHHNNDHPFVPINIRRSNDSNNPPHPPMERDSNEYYQPIGMRRSNDSNPSDLSGPLKESYSDRMKIDPMKYLRGSKQSQSDLSDTGGLMSTGQVIAAAFQGGDSADFDLGHDDHFHDIRPFLSSTPNEAPPHKAGKQAVRIPTLESIEQSERSQSDLSEIIISH